MITNNYYRNITTTQFMPILVTLTNTDAYDRNVIVSQKKTDNELTVSEFS